MQSHEFLNITTGMTNSVLSINPFLFEPHSQADKFPKEWWNVRSMLAWFWQVSVNIHLLSTIAHFIHNKYCCTSSGTLPICAPVAEDQLCGAGCMCDTALACVCPNKEGFCWEFQSQERWTSGGELWPEATTFPTKYSRSSPSDPLVVFSSSVVWFIFRYSSQKLTFNIILQWDCSNLLICK